MTLTLEDLVQYLRKNVPQPKAIKHMVADDKAKVITFEWQSRRFAVQTSLQTFELKGTGLFITGASSLLQLILTTKTRNLTVIGELYDTLSESMNLLNGDQKKGLSLLQSVKTSLARLSGKQVQKKTPAQT